MTNSADLVSCESADIQRRILELIEGASSIAISGHTSPDGDALGSVLGLGLSLMKAFPDKDIALLLADDDPVPRIYRFMEGADRLVPASSFTGDPDLFISVDVPVVERLNNSADVLRRSKHVVCFDHHPAREEFAEVSLRRVDAAACAMIIDRFLERKLKDPEDRKQVKKAADALVRRGFSWSQASSGIERFRRNWAENH